MRATEPHGRALVPAPDSQVLDSSALSIDAVAELIVRWYRERTGGLR